MAIPTFPLPAGDIIVEDGVPKRNHSVSPRSSLDEMVLDHSENSGSFEKGRSDLLKPLDHGVPGDAALFAMVNRGPEQQMQSKRKSQFYGDVFAVREPTNTPKDRVTRDSVVTVEIKTNVIIEHEFEFITSLSTFLSERYQRPESSILVTMSHSACLLFGGSFDPAYFMTISAVPSLVQATLNKRNAALIQRFFAEELAVPPERGVLKFDAVPEENLATNGTTVLAEIEKESRPSPTETNFSSLTRRLTSSRKRPTTSYQSRLPTPPRSPAEPNPFEETDLSRQGSRSRSKSINAAKSKDLEIETSNFPIPEIPTLKSPMDIRAEKVQRMTKRRSFLHMFGKS